MHASPQLEHSAQHGHSTALVIDDRVHTNGVALVKAVENGARRLGCRDMEVTNPHDHASVHSPSGFRPLTLPGLADDDVRDHAARCVKSFSSARGRTP